MIQLDEIRCHVSLSPMFSGETLLGPMVTVAPVTSGPFYCPLVQVVNRSPVLSGHQERNEAEPMRIRRLCQGDPWSSHVAERATALSPPRSHWQDMDFPWGLPGEKKERGVFRK